MKHTLPNEGMRRLLSGYRDFFNGNPARKGFCAIHAEQVATKQNPHSMIISCFDSRVCPEAIFNTHDGHVCIHRNMLNQVCERDESMIASLRFALETLKVQNIVILGHSDCNAVQKLRHLEELPAQIRSWLERSHTCYRGSTVDEAVKNNVLDQLAHLRQIPFVSQAVQEGKVNLEGLFFRIHDGGLERFDPSAQTWYTVSTEEENA